MEAKDIRPAQEQWPAVLLNKARLAEHVLRTRHVADGLVYPMVGEVPAKPQARHVFVKGATEMTARRLAALSFAASVEPSEELSRAIEETFCALERAHDVTGVPGMLARAYLQQPRVAEGHAPDLEDGWHEADGYVWLSGSDVDVYAVVLFSYAVFHDTCAEEAQKQRIARQAEALLRRLIDHDLVVTDVDGKPVKGSSLAPGSIKLPWRVLGLQALAMFRVGHRVTQNQEYLAKYRELAVDHDYARKGVQLGGIPGDRWGHADDCRAFEAYYHLVQYEDDQELTRIYRRNLDTTWEKVKGQERAYLAAIYKALTPTEDVDGEVLDVLLRMPVVKEVPQPDTWDGAGPETPTLVPIERRPPTPFEWMASPYRAWYMIRCFAPVDYLIAYWMGRYHDVIEGP